MSDPLEEEEYFDEDQDELAVDDCVACGGWGYHVENGRRCGVCGGSGTVKR